MQYQVNLWGTTEVILIGWYNIIVIIYKTRTLKM